MIAALVTASFVMASIGAYYLLTDRFVEHARIFVRTVVVAGTCRFDPVALPNR
jgi:cytochrome d ubiquinol oxidase subunit I